KGLAAASLLWAPRAAAARNQASSVGRPPFLSRRIVVEARGEGPDVILIPGLASTAAVWSNVAGAMAASRRLHLVSVNGFGDLPARDNARGPIIGPVADELRRYIAEQQLIRPAVI